MAQFQCVGVDVSKDKFDVALYLNDQWVTHVFSSDNKGYKAFLKWLAKYTETPWVCMEATGHYSEVIAEFLVDQNIRVSVVNPLQIKNFARTILSRNKTDALDAKIIANYCQTFPSSRLFIKRENPQKEVRDLTNILETLKDQCVQVSNQLHSVRSEEGKKALRRSLQQREKEIERIEKQLVDIIKSNPSLNENMKLITSIKGVGQITAFKILAQVRDINCFNNAKQFAAFIGISPRQHQSGKFKGKTTISRLGDSRLRKALYMAALVAKRYNKSLRPFVDRLEMNGKAKKVIICAVMRKLAHIIFGVLKNKNPFNHSFA